MENMNKTVGCQEDTYIHVDYSAPYTTPGETCTYRLIEEMFDSILCGGNVDKNTKEIIMNVAEGKLGITTIIPDDIERTHRIGRLTEGRLSAILLKFNSYKMTTNLYKIVEN